MKKKTILSALMAATLLSASAQTKIICHRGYWTTEGSAQNSIRSLIKADSIGAYGSEFDVWYTVDGKFVVNHDCDFKGVNMRETPFKEIRKVRLNNGEQIPTLDEYLKCGQKLTTRMILEIKGIKGAEREAEGVKKIIKKVKKYKLLDRTDFIAFSLNACKIVKELLPNANVYYLTGDISPDQLNPMQLRMDYHYDAFKKHPEWMDEAHKLGQDVNVWTVDDESTMKYIIRLGADFITTNEPVRLQKLLAK